MNKRIIIICFVLTIFSCFCYGQRLSPEVKKLSDRFYASFRERTKNKSGMATARFVTDVFCSDDYNMDGKLYYINTSKQLDSSVLRVIATFAEKSLRFQGAKRTIDKSEADIIISFSIKREKGMRTHYFSRKNSLYSSSNMGSFETYRPETHKSSYGTSSASNPNLPYYKESFGPAGERSRKIIGAYRISDHYLSLIIDACSREGEPLWQLSSTSYSMIPYSYSVIPYLVFATIGHFGVQGRDGIQFTSENPLYKLWHDGLLNADQVFFSPQHKPAGKICVNALIKENDTLMIVLKHKKQDVYFEGKEFCIEFGGKKFPAIDFYSDRWIHKNYYPSLMVIKFAVHNDLPEMFDLVFYNKKGKEKLSIRDIVFRK